MEKTTDKFDNKLEETRARDTLELSRVVTAVDMADKDSSDAQDEDLDSDIKKKLAKEKMKLKNTEVEVDAEVEDGIAKDTAATVKVDKDPDELRASNKHHEAVVELERLLNHAKSLTAGVL